MKKYLYPFLLFGYQIAAFGEDLDTEAVEVVNLTSSCENCIPSPCVPCVTDCCLQPAASCCTPCGTWEVEIDALYWRTTSTQKIYALNELQPLPSQIDEYPEVKPESDWGVRGKVGYFFPCRPIFAEAQYTFFRQTLSDSTNSPTVVSYFEQVAFQLSSIKASVTDEYQRAGGRLGYNFYNSCSGNFYGFGGIDWLYLKEKERMNGTPLAGGTQNFKQEKTYSSAAFSVGSGGKFYFFNNFGLSGEADLVAAIGNRKNSFFTNIVNTSLDVTNKIHNATILVPGFDLNLELFYEWPCKSICYLFAIGYEQHYFFNALLGNRFYFGPNVNLFPTQFTELHNIGFGGMYLKAKVLF